MSKRTSILPAIVLASAVAANLALGLELTDAVTKARAYVREAIRTNPGLGGGRGPLNFNAGSREFTV